MIIIVLMKLLFTSPIPIEFNSLNEVDHESLNRQYTNFEEELE